MFARFVVVSICFALAADSVSRAQDAPAAASDPQPATQPQVVPVDTTTPRGTLKVLTTAMNAGDVETMRRLILADTPLEARMRESQIELSRASAILRQALVAAFGEQVLAELDGSASVPQQHANIDAAQSDEHGDAAQVTVGPDQYDLRRIDGVWKLSLGSSANVPDKHMLEQSLEEMSIRSEVYQDAAVEIADGRYQSTDEVGQALQGKLMAAMMRQAASREPAATSPAATQEAR